MKPMFSFLLYEFLSLVFRSGLCRVSLCSDHRTLSTHTNNSHCNKWHSLRLCADAYTIHKWSIFASQSGSDSGQSRCNAAEVPGWEQKDVACKASLQQRPTTLTVRSDCLLDWDCMVTRKKRLISWLGCQLTQLTWLLTPVSRVNGDGTLWISRRVSLFCSHKLSSFAP